LTTHPTSKIAESIALEDAFFNEGRLDPAEWERLAIQFDRLDRPHRANSTREKLRRLQSIPTSASVAGTDGPGLPTRAPLQSLPTCTGGSALPHAAQPPEPRPALPAAQCLASAQAHPQTNPQPLTVQSVNEIR